jgi:hypothetical protein
MKVDASIEDWRNLAFQKIGRNVANYQRFEAMLRFVLVFCDVTAQPKDLGSAIARRTAAYAKLPMGHLVDAGAAALFAEEKSLPDSIKTPHIGFSISIDGGKAAAKEWKRELMLIVKERNQLIHKTLTSFDPRSLESCQSLCQELDRQRERLQQPFAHVEALVAAIKEAHLEVANALKQDTASGKR